MTILFTENTQVIFFDLEYYYPDEKMDHSLPSMIYNPFAMGHKLLGGVFEKQYPKNPEKEPERKEFWLWDYNGEDEKRLIQDIFDYFKNSWESLKRTEDTHADLITCGIGIERSDIPVLISVGIKHNLTRGKDFFEYLAKTKVVDFSEVFIPYTKGKTLQYPSTKKEIMKICNIPYTLNKTPVNQLYDEGKRPEIEKRVNQEVNDIIAIHRWVQSNIGKK